MPFPAAAAISGTAAPESEPVTLAYWFDIAPAAREEWLSWYVHEHMPERLGTPFVFAACYEALSASRSHMAIFEASSERDMYAPAYFAVLQKALPDDHRRRSWYSNTVRVTCRTPVRSDRSGGSVVGVLRLGSGDALSPSVDRCLEGHLVPF